MASLSQTETEPTICSTLKTFHIVCIVFARLGY